MVSNGHAWSNIKKYTLGEIGVFVKNIYIKNIYEKIDSFAYSWLANNANEEGKNKIIDGLYKSVKDEKSKNEDVLDNWRRLAKFKKINKI